MQGTVKTYDPRSRTGVLLADDGREFEMDPVSFEGGNLRLLRSGQRLDFEVEEESGRSLARSLKIPTF
jgi:cold shock CspA family protein